MYSVTYGALHQAIVDRSQVVLTYGGYSRECCPHSIGHSGDKERVLVFEFAGGSSTVLPAGGDWRCMDVDAITIRAVRVGPWRTGGGHTKPQRCISRVDMEAT